MFIKSYFLIEFLSDGTVLFCRRSSFKKRSNLFVSTKDINSCKTSNFFRLKKVKKIASISSKAIPTLTN